MVKAKSHERLYKRRPGISNIGDCLFYFVLGVSKVFSYTRARTRISTRGLAFLLMGLSLFITLGTMLARPVQTDAISINNTINFQARLETSSGAIVPDGYYNVEFKLYNASTSSGSSQGSCTGDADCLWTEDYVYNGGSPDNRIQVINGYLTANLGSITSFPSTINWNQPLWLTMNIGGTGTSPSWDGEMSPRLKLTAVPYAFRAGALTDPAGSGASLLWATQSSANTLQLPNETGTICTNATGGVCSALYIQNQNASAQTTANFDISGTGTASVLNATTLEYGGANINTAGTLSSVVYTSNTQTISGVKTFSSDLTASSGTTGLSVTGAPANNGTSSVIQIGNSISSGNTLTNGGTYIGLNEPSSGAGSAADFLNFEVNGTSKLKVDNSGDITASGTYNSNTFNSTTLTFGSTSSGSIQGGGANTFSIDNSSSGGTLTVGNANASTIDVGTNNAAHTIGIGNTGSTGTQAITIGGSGNSANTLTLDAGTGSSAIQIGNSAYAHGIQIGTGAAVQTIVEGSTNSTSALTLQAGTGNLYIQTQGGTLGIGNNSVQQTLQIGNNTSSTSVNVDCGASASSCNFGATANAHSTNLGSSNSTSSTYINGGTGGTILDSYGNVNLGNSNATAVNIGNTSNSTITENVKSSSTAFLLQTTSSATILLANTSGTNIDLYVGSVAGSSTPPLFFLGNDTSSSDPSAATGAMYFNSSTGTFRCDQGGIWQNCLGGLVYTATSGSASSCTSACSALATSPTIPAGYCANGRVLHIYASGTASSYTSGSDNTTLTLDWNTSISQSIVTNGGVSMKTSLTSVPWDIDAYMICPNAAASTQLVYPEADMFLTTSSSAINQTLANGTGNGYAVANTNLNATITLVPAFANSSSSNSISLDQFIITSE